MRVDINILLHCRNAFAMGMSRDIFRGWLWGTRTAYRAANSLTDSTALAYARSQVRPSAVARRTGVLAPGDACGAGDRQSFLDYRGIAIPGDYPSVRDGVVSVGKLCHPQHGPVGEGLVGWPQLTKHAAVIGPSGSGKTVGVIAPWIAQTLRLGISVITVDIKGDLVDEIRRSLAGQSLGVKVRRWGLAPEVKSASWNPLDEIVNAETLQAVVTALLGEIDTAHKDSFFQERDHRWLRGIIRLCIASSARTTLADAYAMVIDRSLLRDHIRAYPTYSSEVVDLANMSEPDASLATSGLANRLAWTIDPVAVTRTATSEFTLQNVMGQPGLTIVDARLSQGPPAFAAAATFLGMLRAKIFKGFGQPIHPTLMILDEVARYADRIELPLLLDLARGAGVGIVVATQDVVHLGDEDRRTRQLANCHTMIMLRGASHISADFFAKRLGSHAVDAVSISTDSHGRAIPSTSKEHIPVLGHREIMHPPLGPYAALMHAPSVHARPFLIDLAKS